MAAAFSEFVEEETILDCFERATGLQACFRPSPAADGVFVAHAYDRHRSAFCDAVKREVEAACAKCDHADLPAACATDGGGIAYRFVRACHAGAGEILLPPWSKGCS